MQPSPLDQQELIRKNAKTGLTVLGIVVFMIGLSFASVPLYRLFCQVTGFGGTTQVSAELPNVVLDRTVTIRFNADTSPNMPWDFKPELLETKVKLGERGLTAYAAHNPQAKPTAGTALYNVTPLKAGKYFHKIQCFCFDEQILEPGQRVSMPVMFYVDPAMDADPNMRDVHTITLSYTFYPAESKALEDALTTFYNEGGVVPASAGAPL
jgi:cytochrome c oxidase assembly protein subunit 11